MPSSDICDHETMWDIQMVVPESFRTSLRENVFGFRSLLTIYVDVDPTDVCVRMIDGLLVILDFNTLSSAGVPSGVLLCYVLASEIVNAADKIVFRVQV